jgi:hypothetical protein
MKNIHDFRNYKVSCERAKVQLGYQSQFTIPDIVSDLFTHPSDYGDLNQEKYFNIQVFKRRESRHLKVS